MALDNASGTLALACLFNITLYATPMFFWGDKLQPARDDVSDDLTAHCSRTKPLTSNVQASCESILTDPFHWILF
ncbi:hypothetical protein BDW74DRAFT_148193 [Aspergillus multicolor]|uniref:uncharacterized protein n=1 Tax=Aspergillus multicolor TaxID=41759 RepID=UPI003CCE4242